MDSALVSCPFCSFRFDPAKESCHYGCPMSSGCGLIKCPNCSYEFVNESRTVNLVKKIVGKIKGDRRPENN